MLHDGTLIIRGTHELKKLWTLIIKLSVTYLNYAFRRFSDPHFFYQFHCIVFIQFPIATKSKLNFRMFCKFTKKENMLYKYILYLIIL